MTPYTKRLQELLAEGLDLCVRARKLDELIEWLEAGHPENSAPYPIQRINCKTPHLWVMQQYDDDLADWERRAKLAITVDVSEKT